MLQSERYQYSGNTPHKQWALRTLLGLHMDVVQAIWSKYSNAAKTYEYFDLYAGPGIDPNGNPGSPLVFYEEATKRNLPYRATLFEADENTFQKLSANTKGLRYFSLWNSCNDIIVGHLDGIKRPNYYGIAYSDPSNATIPEEPLKAIIRAYPKVDIAINIAAASYKRSVMSDTYESLHKRLIRLKRYWNLYKPHDKFQWTILLGTNWKDFPEWISKNFVNFNSPAGRTWYESIVLTKAQRQAIYQPALFDEPPYRTYEEYLRHPKFRAIRAQAMEAAKGVCQRCKKARATEVHHLRYPPWGTFDTVDNLLPVCHQCHCEIHGKES